MTKSSFNLSEHLKNEHKISPVQTYLKEIVYGGSDGIITTFAVVAGFSGAQAGSVVSTYPYAIVLLFGLANLFADATSMGLSNFLSLRSEKDLYRAEEQKELYEIRNHPKEEKEETIEILKQKGFSEKDAIAMALLYAKNEKYWLSFMMNDELEMPNPKGENPLLTGLATFSAFMVFGFIPLIPYVVGGGHDNLFYYSIASAFSALFLLGLVRYKVTGESVVRSVSEVLLIGGLSATIAYVVGTFFAL